MTKIIFFGTSQFSARILKKVSGQFEIPLVITQPDKPVGRKQQTEQSAVAKVASELGLGVIKPAKLKDPEIVSAITAVNPDLFLVVAYGKIIPKEILDLPKIGSINIHGSLLPKYRGASPIQSALLNGEKETGISIMLMDEQMDHGPVLQEQSLPINPDETFPELESRMAELAENTIVQCLQDFIDGKIKPREQNHEQATFTKIISKDDGKIDWQKTAGEIYNMYRAFYSWPGIWTVFENKILKITKCKPAEPADRVSSTAVPGTVIQDGQNILVKTSKGFLQILEVQQEGKKNMAIEQFINGHKNFIGAKL